MFGRDFLVFKWFFSDSNPFNIRIIHHSPTARTYHPEKTTPNMGEFNENLLATMGFSMVLPCFTTRFGMIYGRTPPP